MSFLSLLSHRCTIQTFVAGAAGGDGKPTGTWTNTYTSVPCRFQGAGRGVESVQAREIVNADFVLYLQAGQAITERDRVSAITERGGTSIIAETFHVISVRPVGGKHQVAYLELVR